MKFLTTTKEINFLVVIEIKMINWCDEPRMIISRLNMASIVLHRIDNRSGFIREWKITQFVFKMWHSYYRTERNNFLTCSCWFLRGNYFFILSFYLFQRIQSIETSSNKLKNILFQKIVLTFIVGINCSSDILRFLKFSAFSLKFSIK